MIVNNVYFERLHRFKNLEYLVSKTFKYSLKFPIPDSGIESGFPKNLVGTGINSVRESLARDGIGNELRVPDLIGNPIPTGNGNPN